MNEHQPRHPKGAPSSIGGQWVSDDARAASAMPQVAATAAQREIDGLATYLATREIDSQLNEAAADAVANAGLGLPHPGSEHDDDMAFWRVFTPSAPAGSPERSLQEIGKHLGGQATWKRGTDNYEFIAGAVRDGGGAVDPHAEDYDDAIDRLSHELESRFMAQDNEIAADTVPGEIVTLSAGLLGRAVRAEVPDAAAIEVRNDLADDGEMWLQVLTVRDEQGVVIARADDISEHTQQWAVTLDRDFATLAEFSSRALRSRSTWGEEMPAGENDPHFILIDDAIARTGPEL